MRRTLIWLVPLTLLLVGVAGTWWWRSGRDAPRQPAPAAPVVTGGGGAGGPGPDRGDRGGDTGAGTMVWVDDDPVGAMILEGQVVDAQLQPVGGATVVLASNPPRTAVSEDDGSFSFDQLVGRTYSLVARAAGGVAGPATVRLAAATEPVILQLRPGAQVEVLTVDRAGAPVGKASVELRGNFDTLAGTSDGAGRVVFPVVMPGGYEVVAWADGMAKSFTRASVTPPKTEVRVTVVPGAAVSGVVVGPAGPVAGARVNFVGASDWTEGDERRDGVLTGADGAFRFAALPAGSVRLVARHDDFAPGSSSILTLDGVTPRDGVRIELAPGVTVTGKVVDGAGAPAASARVRIGVASNSFVGDAPRQAYTDATGAFTVAGLPRKKLALAASHDSGSSDTVEVDASAGDPAPLTIRLDVTGIIAGVVVDPRGDPVEGVQVSAGPNFRAMGRNAGRRGGGQDLGQQFRLRGFPQDLTDSGGRFRLTGLAKGSYMVRANRATSAARGRGWAGEGTEAEAGTTDLKLVLQVEGGVRGKVVLADGTVPDLFVVGVGMTQETFAGADGAFVLDGLPPSEYRLSVRGPRIDGKTVQVTVEPGKVADVGTITVTRGRLLAGRVVDPSGQPVADATVLAGRQLFGTGSSAQGQGRGGPPMGRAKSATTDADGAFALAGFGPGEITIVAEHPERGRSAGQRIAAGDPREGELVLTIQPYGALTGVLRQGGQPAEGVFVTAQAVSTPSALFNVASGPDGAYRFDKLAPDTYKVSATLGMPMVGMRFYSKEVVVESGKESKVDLAVEKGGVTVVANLVARAGTVGVASVWLASGLIAAANQRELGLRLGMASTGSSQWAILPQGGAARFPEVVPGPYTVCAVTFPTEIQGMAAMGYGERHGDVLPAYCQSITVGAAPAEQAVSVQVAVPALIPDEGGGPGGGGPPGGGRPPGGGSGSGSGPPPPGP
ncbi:MAG: carboxypeptidase regulatory-like domain-containing protein [Kofleriaceae bacterium]|nr:carboxypeptidase regulatory-like domain-containing protein [Kofleriaceae bacterium]